MAGHFRGTQWCFRDEDVFVCNVLITYTYLQLQLVYMPLLLNWIRLDQKCSGIESLEWYGYGQSQNQGQGQGSMVNSTVNTDTATCPRHLIYSNSLIASVICVSSWTASNRHRPQTPPSSAPSANPNSTTFYDVCTKFTLITRWRILFRRRRCRWDRRNWGGGGRLVKQMSVDKRLSEGLRINIV